MSKLVSSIFQKHGRLLGEYPFTLVDVGAGGGIPKEWVQVQKHLRVIGFEPEASSFSHLVSSQTPGQNINYLNTGLFDRETTVDFHETRYADSSSILKPNSKFLARFPYPESFEVEATRKIKVDTLDNQLSLASVNDVDFLKLDTQGSELFILKGAREAVRNRICGMKIEVEFAPIYEGQPLFSDVDRFVREFGFELFDLRPVYWKRAAGVDYGKVRGQLIWADALYFRGFEGAFSLWDGESEEFKKAKVLKLMLAALSYGYVDYALEIVERLETRKILGQDTVNSLTREMHKERSIYSRVPRIRGRGRLARILYALSCHLGLGWRQQFEEPRDVGNFS